MHNNKELLFWKIYHNKFLRNLIFYHINSTDWVEYKDYRGVKANSRLKFKEITSLSWMIKKKQFQLLKYKLECNQDIQIDSDSFSLLIKEFNKHVPISSSSSSINNTNENKIEILYSILKLFLEKKRDQCEANELPKLALEYNDLDLFNTLINEPYSMKIYPLKYFKTALQFCSVNNIEILFKQQQQQQQITTIMVNDNQDENSISIIELLGIASRNRIESEQLMKLLLFGNETTKIINFNNYSSNQQSTTKPINFLMFFLFKSIELKEKIMELNLIGPFRMTDLFPFENSICRSRSFKEMLLNIKIYFNYLSKSTITESLEKLLSNDSNIDEGNKLKELHKTFLIFLSENQKKENFNSLYKNYIVLYKESIDEIKDQQNFEIGCNREAIIFYKYFCETNNNRKYFSDTSKTFITQFRESIENKTIKSWYPIFNIFVNQQQQDQDQEYTDEISILIIDKQFIDWIIECDLKILYHFLDNCNQINFNTFELFKYAMDIGFFKKVDSNRFELILKNMFFNALKDKDHCIQHLKYLDSLGFKLNQFDIIKDKQLSIILEDKLLHKNLISYINDNNGLEILKSREMFSLFYKIYLDDKNGLKELNLNSIISARYEFDVLIFSLFKSSFIDLEYFNYILNRIPFGTIESGPQFKLSSHLIKILKLSSVSTSTSMSFNKSILNYSNAKFTFKLSIQETIINLKLIFKKLIDIKNQDESKSCEKSIQLVIRILFEKFIEIEYIGANDVLEIYNYLKSIDPQFEIEKNIYYSYYFLEIRSKKFINYLMSTKLIEKVFGSYRSDIQDEDDNDYINYFLTFFDPNIFSFEMILNKINGYFIYSFDYILEKLIYQLSTLPIKKYNENPILNIEIFGLDFISGQIEQDLTFYLEIRRIDLFFNKLDYIKLNLSKEINYIDQNQKDQQYNLYYFYYNQGVDILESSNNNSSNNIINDLNFLDINEFTNENYQDFNNNYNKLNEPFHLSDSILSLAIFIMDIKSIEKLISYYNHIPNNTFTSLLLKLSIENNNRFDIIQYLDKNYNNKKNKY